MAARIRFRRGTTAQHAAFTGAQAEITVNTSKNTAVVHDGSTQGGFELLRADFDNLDGATVIPGAQVDALDGGSY
jgi:hypothetical protein